MKDEEFVTCVVFNNKHINVGLDDAGQTYFIQYTDDNGEDIEECVGSYEVDYMRYIEWRFGSPDMCSMYKDIEYDQKLSYDNIPNECKNKSKYGFCDRCPYQDYDWYVLCQLRNLGVLNRHGDTVNQRFKHLFDDNKNKD